MVKSLDERQSSLEKVEKQLVDLKTSSQEQLHLKDQQFNDVKLNLEKVKCIYCLTTTTYIWNAKSIKKETSICHHCV